MQGDNAWKKISGFKAIKVAKGKKILEFSPAPGNREEILKHCLGRTGNLRAPAVDMAGVLYVGYNDEMYQEISQKK